VEGKCIVCVGEVWGVVYVWGGGDHVWVKKRPTITLTCEDDLKHQGDVAANRSADGKTTWLVLGLVALGCVFRLPRLGESLWYDEIAAWLDYAQQGPRVIVTTYYDPANHIFHTLLSWVSVEWLSSWFGQELALRFPAFVFSLLSIVMVYFLARTVAGRRVAFFAGLFAAILPVSVLEGVEARGYSMMICASAAATWIVLSTCKRNAWWKWVIYVVICALGIWAHMMTVWVVIGHFVWLVARGGKFFFDKLQPSNDPVRRDLVAVSMGSTAIFITAVLTLFLYWPVIDDIWQMRGQFASETGNEPSVLGAEGLHTLLQLGGSWYWWAAIPGLLLFSLGIFTALRSFIAPDRASDEAYIRPGSALLLALLGLPIMAVVLYFAGSWMYARFALFALPGSILAMAIGLDWLWSKHRVFGIVMLLCLVGVGVGEISLRPPKQPLREAADVVRTVRVPGETVLILGLRHRVMKVYATDLYPDYISNRGQNFAQQFSWSKPNWIIVLYPHLLQQDQWQTFQRHGYIEKAHLEGWVDWGGGDVIILHSSD